MTDKQDEKAEAIRRAQAWWEGREDPENAAWGTYVCDSCNGPIHDKERTSLVGTYMRCKKCTDRLFE
ncbi:MAG: hypothetical protein ACETWK_02330 [Candidatus Aminicenantaceae bacterium]